MSRRRKRWLVYIQQGQYGNHPPEWTTARTAYGALRIALRLNKSSFAKAFGLVFGIKKLPKARWS